MTVQIDETDRRILMVLQENGRITNVALADRVGISAPPCLRRVRALEEAGIIQGYSAELDAVKLGFEISSFVMVGLANQAESDLIAFEELARSWEIVRECYMMSGEIDFLLLCATHDLKTFQDFVVHEVAAAENVANIKSTVIIRRSKRAPAVPIAPAD